MNKNITLEDRIHQTALDMFSTHGFDAVTINHICREVGITKPTFYRYVTGKEEILNRYYMFKPDELFPGWDEVKNGNYWKAIENGFLICYSHYLSLGVEMLSRLMMAQINKNGLAFQADPDWNRKILDLIVKAKETSQIETQLKPEALLELMTTVSLGYCYYTCTEETEILNNLEYSQVLRTIARVSDDVLT